MTILDLLLLVALTVVLLWVFTPDGFLDAYAKGERAARKMKTFPECNPYREGDARRESFADGYLETIAAMIVKK
jgi:hypothetical protein